jgi:hypothetical protein
MTFGFYVVNLPFKTDSFSVLIILFDGFVFVLCVSHTLMFYHVSAFS